MVRESVWKRTKAYFRRMRGNRAGGWIALLLLLIIGKEVGAESDNNGTIDYRLPTDVLPFSYDIKFSPNIVDGNFTFCGDENITIGVINETSNITLHAHHHLQIDQSATQLFTNNGTIILPKDHIRTNITDFLTLIFDNNLPIGNYTLILKFTGNINKETVGIYRSSYLNENNERQWIIATRFSQTKARRAFPCWDEPALKATFNLSIKHCSNYTAASNMPIRDKQTAEDGKIFTNFMITPKMSTYLVAFVITDFTCMKSDGLNNTNKSFNICANKKILTDLSFIQEIQAKAIAALEKISGEFYLPKLDSYAIPDTDTPAMENWGLSIHRESKIAIKKDMPDSMKAAAAEVVINDLSHQWFANVVSPAWWKYSWIKEGLSHYMQFYIGNEVFPEWDLMRMYIVRIVQTSTFRMDTSANSNNVHYLNWEPKSPADIKTLFYAQMYQKGSVVMYMLSHILTREVFKEGIRLYLKKFQYGAATSDDFWNVMQEAYNDSEKNSNINVKDVMLPWIEQTGYPIVKVVRDADGSKAIINQTSNILSQASNRWCIPINYATKSNPNFNSTAPTQWLKPYDANLIIDELNKDDWIIVNLQQSGKVTRYSGWENACPRVKFCRCAQARGKTEEPIANGAQRKPRFHRCVTSVGISGYYRVDYDETNWKKLISYLNNDDYEKIDTLNRAQFINDLSYMASNEYQNYTTFFELTQYLARETDLIPWKIAGHAFKLLKQQIIDKDTQQNIRKYIVRLMKKIVDQIGFEDRPTDSYAVKKKRAVMLPLACKFGHPECIAAASEKFLAHLENPKSQYLDLWISCYGGASEKAQTMLMERIENGEMQYFAYLGCSKNSTYWRHYIEKALTNSSIPKNNTRLAFAYANTDTIESWEWVVSYFTTNFDRLVTYFQGTPFASSIVADLIWKTPTADRIDKIRELVDKGRHDHLSPWVPNAIPQQIRRLEWNKANTPIINDWLQKQSIFLLRTPKL